MHYILVYDISDDDTRDKIRELLKNYGARRIQYSAFKIELEEAQLIELLQKAERLLKGTEGSLIAIPTCKRDQEKTISIGKQNHETTIF